MVSFLNGTNTAAGLDGAVRFVDLDNDNVEHDAYDDACDVFVNCRTLNRHYTEMTNWLYERGNMVSVRARFAVHENNRASPKVFFGAVVTLSTVEEAALTALYWGGV